MRARICVMTVGNAVI